MIVRLMGLMGGYVFQGVNLILTFWECFICIALFARKLERKNFFAVRVTIALIEGAVICFLLAIWYTEAESLLVRILCYFAISGLNFIFLLFCWKADWMEIMLAFCSGMAAYQFTNKLYPLLQNLMGINDRETNSLFIPNGTVPTDLTWIVFLGFHLLSFVG